MKRLIVLLCALYLVLPFGTASAAPPNKVKTTLDDIPSAWSMILRCDTSACPRFELVMGGAAVLDHETGLVWEQSPSNTTFDWIGAIDHCLRLEVGGRKGWHLPTIEQLMSLVDTSAFPTLPAGHPFTGVQFYWMSWSATTASFYTGGARFVQFTVGDSQVYDKSTGLLNVWCVRGGQSNDGY